MVSKVDKENDEPKERVYKGELVEIGPGLQKLVGKFVQRIGPNTQAQGWDGYGPIPHFMQVESATPAGRDGVWQVFGKDPRSGFIQRWAFLDPKVHKLNVLTGRMGVTLTKELWEYQKANLGKNILYPGGSIGCDPEIFVVDEKNAVIPAWEFLPSKKKPMRAGDWHGKGSNTLYWDGFQAEYTTPPYGCLGHEMDTIQAGLWGILNAARGKFKGAKLSRHAVLPVDPKVLAEAEDQYVEFGCMPSKNAYGMEGMTAYGRETPLRFAGGHLHFGIARSIAKKGKETRVVKSLDKILGVTSVALFAGYENPARRQYYGLPGEYRTPEHGLEYRVLPNAWLIHPVITNITFEMARKVIGYGLQPNDHWSSPEEEVIEVIRNSDIDMAKTILKRNEEIFKSLFNFTIFADGSVNQLFDLCYNGMGEYLEEPDDIAANWGLNGGEREWLLHCEGPGMNWTKGKLLLKDGKKLPRYEHKGVPRW